MKALLTANLALALSGTAFAATLSVTGPLDAVAPDGVCTLREAVLAANGDQAVDSCAAGSGADTIELPAGSYVLTRVGAGEDAGDTGDLDLDGTLTIRGAGADATTIDGGGIDRVLHALPGAVLRLEDLTITGGRLSSGASPSGGGLWLQNADAELERVRVLANRVGTATGVGAGGAGIYVTRGSLTIRDAEIADNRVELNEQTLYETGGGINVDLFSDLSVERALFADNRAFTGAGLECRGSCTLTSSTFVGNAGGGSAINTTGGEVLVDSCTLIGTPSSDVGVVLVGGVIRYRNTILDGDCGRDGADGSRHESLGSNIGLIDFCFQLEPTDMARTDPRLGELADHGGFARSIALLPDSQAIDSGADESCPTTDQRGVARPQDGPGLGYRSCDRGAFEMTAGGAR